MRNSMVIIASLLATILITSNYAVTEAAVSCPIAVGAISPCLPYLTDHQDKPSPPCCGGFARVKDMGRSKEDIRGLCDCLINASKSVKVDFNRAAALPGLCSVSLPFPIKPDMDCSKL